MQCIDHKRLMIEQSSRLRTQQLTPCGADSSCRAMRWRNWTRLRHPPSRNYGETGRAAWQGRLREAATSKLSMAFAAPDDDAIGERDVRRLGTGQWRRRKRKVRRREEPKQTSTRCCCSRKIGRQNG